MATFKDTGPTELALQAASDALLRSLPVLTGIAAVTAKIKADAQEAANGDASALADALDACIAHLRSILMPAQEAAFDACMAAQRAEVEHG